jgi:hypothetical protein
MGLPICSVCGLVCAEYMTAGDDIGNPAGEWIHIVCRAQTGGSYDSDGVSTGSLAGHRIPKTKKGFVCKLRIQSSGMAPSVRHALPGLQKNTVQLRQVHGCHRL